MHYEVTRFPRLKNKKWADILALRGDKKDEIIRRIKRTKLLSRRGHDKSSKSG
jgi:hypothetical protein